MYEEPETKKRSRLWILPVAIVIACIIGYVWYSVYYKPKGNQNAMTNEETGEVETFTIKGTEIINQEFAEQLPYNLESELTEGRYDLEYLSEEPVWLWISKEGKYKGGTGCCREEQLQSHGKFKFDVNRNEAGTYEFEFRGNDSPRIKLRLIQSIGF